MQSSDYLVWDADPTAINLGTIPLPFEMSTLGLIAAFIAFFWGMSKMVPEKGASEEEAPPAWKLILLAVGSLIGGQILFLILPSPTITEIGPIQPRWYGFLFMGAFIAGYIIMRRMMVVHGGRKQEELDRLLMYVLIGTIIGARLGHVIFYDLSYYLRNPAQIVMTWKGGLASHGAAVGILTAMYLYIKKTPKMNFLWLTDRVVIVVALGGAFIRTGNFINSEIIGKPTDLPWAVIFPKLDMLPRHPTMLYEAILCLVLFGILWQLYKRYQKQPPEGSIFGIFLVVLFTGRFLLEFTKISQAEFASDWLFNMGQWLSLPLIGLGVWLLWKKVNWKQARAQSAESGA